MTALGGRGIELAGQRDGNLGEKILGMMESTSMKRLSQMLWNLVGGTRCTYPQQQHSRKELGLTVLPLEGKSKTLHILGFFIKVLKQQKQSTKSQMFLQDWC